MPIVEISMVEGRDEEAKRRLHAEVTDAVVRSIGVRPDQVRVLLREVPAINFAVAGLPKQDEA
jgi:4-oxalocrotonate tautomerase